MVSASAASRCSCWGARFLVTLPHADFTSPGEPKHRALIDINNQMFKETGRVRVWCVETLRIHPNASPSHPHNPTPHAQYPMNLYAAIRWLSASECPLSGAYGHPGERFVLIEASSAHGTVGWEEFCQRVLDKFSTLHSKVDGSLPKPHWGKVNKVRHERSRFCTASHDMNPPFPPRPHRSSKNTNEPRKHTAGLDSRHRALHQERYGRPAQPRQGGRPQG